MLSADSSRRQGEGDADRFAPQSTLLSQVSPPTAEELLVADIDLAAALLKTHVFSGMALPNGDVQSVALSAAQEMVDQYEQAMKMDQDILACASCGFRSLDRTTQP